LAASSSQARCRREWGVLEPAQVTLDQGAFVEVVRLIWFLLESPLETFASFLVLPSRRRTRPDGSGPRPSRMDFDGPLIGRAREPGCHGFIDAAQRVVGLMVVGGQSNSVAQRFHGDIVAFKAEQHLAMAKVTKALWELSSSDLRKLSTASSWRPIPAWAIPMLK